jgi:hypothetical protein
VHHKNIEKILEVIMEIEKVISSVESTIINLSKDVKKRRLKVSVERLHNLSKLVNSYTRLIDRKLGLLGSDGGGKNYYENLEKDLNER